MASTNMVVDGVDVESLNDEELFTRLQALGATCGPIVASTRKIYQKKLMVLMGGDVVDGAQYNGDVDLDEEEEEEYSDNEEPVEEPVVEPRKTRLSAGADVTGTSSSKTTTTTTSYTSNYSSSGTGSPVVRRRVAETLAASPTSTGTMSFDPDRHTPSPRRSLRTVTGSTSETITVRKTVNNGSSAKLVSSEQTSTELKEAVDEESGSKLGSLCRLLVKLILLALLIVVLLYVYQLYQENSPENPMKALEELAKQALEAATGQQVEAGDGPVPPAAVPPAAASPPAAAPPAAAPPAVAPPAPAAVPAQ